MTEETLSNLLRENRRFDPPAEMAKSANITAEAHERANANRLAFWAEQAEQLSWKQRWDRVLDWDDPLFAKWFVGGKLNAAYNCVDRHVEEGRGRVAFRWVSAAVEAVGSAGRGLRTPYHMLTGQGGHSKSQAGRAEKLSGWIVLRVVSA